MSENRLAKFKELYERGVDLLEKNKDDEATALFYEAAQVAPEGWLALATELIKDGQADLALERLNEVLKLTKNAKIRAATLNNIGMILANRGQNEPAIAAFEEASRLAPEFADTFSNLGLMRKWAGDFPGALRYLEMALKRDPWHEQAQFVHSMAVLLSGDYLRGFQEYECRWRSKTNKLQKIISPVLEWDGTFGKRLLVYGEQGHGDLILAVRYARLIREMGLDVIWVSQASMAPLLRTVPELNQVLEPNTELPDFDCHIPAVSLPRIFKTTLDNIPPAPYIPKPEPIDYGPGIHVGIVWRGSHAQGNDLFRSTNLDLWQPVLDVTGATFHSLQVDNANEALLYPRIITHEPPKDWLETARRVAGLDLVISVDTSIVHLCGAMGFPVWVPLHCRPYFVYPPRCGEKTPWYDSVKLYRQQKEFDWQPVFQRIADDLCSFIRSQTQPDGETSPPCAATTT